MTLLRSIRRQIRRFIRLLTGVMWRLVMLVALLGALGDGTFRDDSLQARVTALARDRLFDYVTWEVDALWGKVRQEWLGVGPYLDDERQHDQVIDFLARLSDVQDLEAEIERVYTDPNVADPDAASADLRAERDCAPPPTGRRSTPGGEHHRGAGIRRAGR